MDSSGLVALDYGYSPDFNETDMTAMFRICTPRQDREGDIIEPSGVDWSDYKNAAVVKYEHGFTGIPLPIASSCDADGKCHLYYGNPNDDEPEDAIYAKAFFDAEDQLSRQMFHLVKIGFLKAASIHVMPGKSKPLASGGTHAFTSSVLEWSICTVGMNPDAFKKSLLPGKKISELKDVVSLQMDMASRILGENRLGGEEIHPSLAKCLSGYQAKKTAIVRGVEMSKLTLTSEEIERMKPGAIAKALASAADYDAESVKFLRAKAKAYDAEEDEDEDEGEGDDVADDLDEVADEIDEIEKALEKGVDVESFRPGQAFLHSVHSELKMLKAKVEAARHATEDPSVLEFSDELNKSIGDALLSVEGAYSKIYKSAVAGADEEIEADEEMVKSWLAESRGSQFVLEGLASRLERGSKDPKAMAKTISGVAKHLRQLSSQAKSHKPKAVDDGQSELASRVEKLAVKLNKVIEAIEGLPA